MEKLLRTLGIVDQQFRPFLKKKKKKSESKQGTKGCQMRPQKCSSLREKLTHGRAGPDYTQSQSFKSVLHDLDKNNLLP